ncbi:PD-(D/E)XK nuclease family protein [Tenacibaculum finnmarkense genomovar finnmarkense]|uniref:PDDEXK-like family protein n=1 Tax=Tenacibaculum finnmarkense TaxID=2781243 RepID=UPI001E349B5F|nr:PD-(D/E)XK nuclease family protein [Tenacibaculum finnmarkense]MCD8417833.1 PD-(D/E)XK nuclease family protein [Tenacibaculum finnmarkense genomovar finnmarkense]MCG8202986.1 PD-(D/E)XK nuclease family protein [Tenacibaculum finnmarkense genomovar finnmarkense]MCG8212886.1 PD-(D/E)XK nuclease family protein [Tenacibaculum finnmarkense genomovar finnmarkense]MCG8220419.1 PD-(D/E)XK nuclease family protein [Tenacibaculum finnmarkense genomovar finnmarkense]MCG8223133.1 PD-(D/E)XK nuclease fam
MKNLLKKIAEISTKYEQLNKISGNDFNVFDVINVTTNEVRLHSKFIAELLNPKGTHGQDDIFLKLFVTQFDVKINTASAIVTVEKYIGVKTETTGGYLDIFISDNKGNAITIENKIYAADQENQLVRYYNHNPNNLFYLNLFGDDPSENSCGKLKIGDDFKIISYQSDIIEWLTNCRKEAVELPLLREGITHYINLIKILTGQSGTTKMNTEISHYIASSADNLKQASLIEQNMTSAKVEIQWLFWQSLKEKMIANGLSLVEEKNVTWQNVNNYYTRGKKEVDYGLWVEIANIKNNMNLIFGIVLDHNIYFGFHLEENGKWCTTNDDEFNKYKEKVLTLNPKYTNNKSWLGWRHTQEKLNFRAFNSDAIFNLADPKKLDELTSKIAENILKDIKALKNKLH